MINLDIITVEDFKSLFTRGIPYLPLFIEGQTYFKGDIVYYENIDSSEQNSSFRSSLRLTHNFYSSLIDANTALPTDTQAWQLIVDNVDNYVQDSDIERAFLEAKVNFNTGLFSDDDVAKMIFLYLAAHYLIIDLSNAQNPFGGGFIGFTQSKSVGSVSESYAIPSWILNNPKLSMYAQTGFGRKYLSLIQPYLVGNIILSRGRTTIG